MNRSIERVRTHFVFDFSHGLDSKSAKRLQTRSLKSLTRLIFLKQHRTGRDYHRDDGHAQTGRCGFHMGRWAGPLGWPGKLFA